MTPRSRWPQRRCRNFPTKHRILGSMAGGAPGTTAPNLNTNYGAPQNGRSPEPNSSKKHLATQRDIGPDSPLPARVSGPVSKTGGTPSVPSDPHDIDGRTKELAAKIFLGEQSASADLPSIPVCGVSGCVARNELLPTTPSPAPGGEERENEASTSCSIIPESQSPAGSCEERPDPGTSFNSTTEGTPLAITVKDRRGENFPSISTGTISNTSSSNSSPDTPLHVPAPPAIDTPIPGHGGRENITSNFTSPHLPDGSPPTTPPIGHGELVTTPAVASQTPPAVIPIQLQNGPSTPTGIISTTQPESSKDAVTVIGLSKVIPETTSTTAEDFATTYSLTIPSEAIRSTPFPNISPGATTSTQNVQGSSPAKSSINTNALIGGSIAAAVLLLAASIFLFFHFRRRPVNEEWRESFFAGPPQLLPDSPLSTRHDLPPPPGPIPMTQTESPAEWRPTFVGTGSNSEISTPHGPVVHKKADLYLDPPNFDEHLKNPSPSSLASFDPRIHLMTPDPFAARCTPIQNPFSDPVPPVRVPFAISERSCSVASTSASESHYKTYGVAL